MKSAQKKSTGIGDKAKSIPSSTSSTCRDCDTGDLNLAASAGDINGATPKVRAPRNASSDGSSSSSSSNNSNSSSELSSFAQSCTVSKPSEVTQPGLKRTDFPRVAPTLCSSSSSSSSNNSSSSSSSSSYEDSVSCSMPESEAFWSELPAMKPLINPDRLQALRLCSRDSRVSDDGDATIMASPASPQRRVAGGRSQRRQQPLDAATSQSQQVVTSGAHARGDFNQCNRNGSPRRHVAETAVRRSSTAPQLDEVACGVSAAAADQVSCGERTAGEMRMAESAQCRRLAIYQYSFRVPDTKANMRPFSDPSDRRVEAIARACDSEVLLDPEPIRPAASIRLRRVTIRAPDPHSLEKCCRMFDDRFPHFFVSGGLGPGGRCVSKVYDDGDEKYISASNDECS